MNTFRPDSLSIAEYSYSDPFATYSHSYILPRIRLLLAQREPGTRILDLGCGNGSLIGAIRHPRVAITRR